jgi:hypothetical protein
LWVATINDRLEIGKYIAKITWENHLDRFRLKITLSWDSIPTNDVFAQIGLFCSEVGSAIEVNILAGCAKIVMVVRQPSDNLGTIDGLGRSINKIRNTLERCLQPDVQVGNSDLRARVKDFLDKYPYPDHTMKITPGYKTSAAGDAMAQNIASQRKGSSGATYLSDSEWNERKDRQKLPQVDPAMTIDYWRT